MIEFRRPGPVTAALKLELEYIKVKLHDDPSTEPIARAIRKMKEQVDKPAPDEPERGIQLTCAWCRTVQRVRYTGNNLAMTRAEGLMLLCLATGGRDGTMPPGFPPFKSAVGTASQIGKSECCDAQIEGELYGEWPEA